MDKLTHKQRQINYEQLLRQRQQQQLVRQWLKNKAINPQRFKDAHPNTLQAIKISKGILDNPKYPLRPYEAKQFQSFIIRANKGINTGRETIDIFRQSKAIKRRQAVL